MTIDDIKRNIVGECIAVRNSIGGQVRIDDLNEYTMIAMFEFEPLGRGQIVGFSHIFDLDRIQVAEEGPAAFIREACSKMRHDAVDFCRQLSS